MRQVHHDDKTFNSENKRSQTIDPDQKQLHKRLALITLEFFDVNDVITTPSLQPPVPKKQQIVEFAVGGMTCSMCSSAVHKALMDMPGVLLANVSLSTNMATIEYEPSEDCSVDILKETIEDMGYDVNDVIESQSQQQRYSDHADLEQQQQGQGSILLIEEADNNDNDDDPDDRLVRILRQQEVQLKARKRDFIWSLIGAIPTLYPPLPPIPIVPYFLKLRTTLIL